MPAFTPEEWLLVGLFCFIALILGMILGYSPKWKRRYREEHARYVDLERDHDARISAANARIAELEGGGAVTGAGIAGATRGTDDLTLIRGIDRDREIALNDAGYHRYKQLAKLSDRDRATIEGRLGADAGLIEREQWREQAELLHKGDLDTHRRDYIDRTG